jgi:hypothetical protein
MKRIIFLCACLFASPAIAAPEVKLDCMTQENQHFVIIEKDRVAHIKFDPTKDTPVYWHVDGNNVNVVEQANGNTLQMVYNIVENNGWIKTVFLDGHVKHALVKCDIGLTGK